MREKRLLFLSPYPVNTAPSQRLKYEQYFSYFKEHGYEVTVSPFVSEKFWTIIYKKGLYLPKAFYTILGYMRRFGDLLRLRQYDLIYVHLWVTPIGPPFMEWLVGMISKRMVYDIDDLVFLDDKRKHNQIMTLIRGRQKPILLMKQANHVICCTPRLYEFVAQFNEHVTDISSTINTEEYVPVAKTEGKSLVIGWSGSHSTSRYLHLLDEVFIELAKEHVFTLKVIGDPDFELSGVNVKAISWNAQNEVKELQEIDIGVYPLPLDEEWVYGKSGLKALQYMALEIPTLATAIGANYRIIDHGQNGYLIDDNQAWLTYLRKLIQDPVIGKKIGVEARKTVKEKYSVKATKSIYIQIIEDTLSSN